MSSQKPLNYGTDKKYLCPICKSELKYNPQYQEYPGAIPQSAYYSCLNDDCEYYFNESINMDNCRENKRGW